MDSRYFSKFIEYMLSYNKLNSEKNNFYDPFSDEPKNLQKKLLNNS